jgi:hypothetical protein
MAPESRTRPLFSQGGNGTLSWPLTGDLIARNPRIIVNTKKNPSADISSHPIRTHHLNYNAKNGTDQYK